MTIDNIYGSLWCLYFAQFRKDFDADREKELEDYKKSRPPVGSNQQNNTNVEEE